MDPCKTVLLSVIKLPLRDRVYAPAQNEQERGGFQSLTRRRFADSAYCSAAVVMPATVLSSMVCRSVPSALLLAMISPKVAAGVQ